MGNIYTFRRDKYVRLVFDTFWKGVPFTWKKCSPHGSKFFPFKVDRFSFFFFFFFVLFFFLSKRRSRCRKAYRESLGFTEFKIWYVCILDLRNGQYANITYMNSECPDQRVYLQSDRSLFRSSVYANITVFRICKPTWKALNKLHGCIGDLGFFAVHKYKKASFLMKRLSASVLFFFYRNSNDCQLLDFQITKQLLK